MVKKTQEEISIMEVEYGQFDVCILGKTPLICHAMSSKAAEELLAPHGRKTAAEKKSTLKHDPIMEYRNSMYRTKGKDAPTEIGVKPYGFKGGMRNAAIDLPGSSKAQIGRLVFVEGDLTPIYGIPQIFCAITRNSDTARTPDVRTRSIIPRWACNLTITYTKPLLKQQAVVNLLAAAGMMQGLGDWRPEKGKGEYGQYKMVSADDPDFLHIIKTGGRQAQLDALEKPEAYDNETETLLSWFHEEMNRRGFKVAA